MISRETPADLRKQETASTTTSASTDNNKLKPSSISNNITSWSRLKDPRIVRVSRAFGGKDRHSKVCTVRGLRDRRVRLSVPTAIQLYDLQDRLGLNQPSKVVDWLLNAAKTEIDELPPLQFPQGSFSASLLPIPTDPKQALTEKPMTSAGGRERGDDDCNWGGRSSHGEEGRHGGFNLGINQESSYDQNPSPSPSANPFNSSFVRWDPSSTLTLSHPPQQGEDWHNFTMQSQQHHHHHHHQLLVYQPTGPTQTYFQSQIAGFQSPAEPSSRPVHFNLLPSQNNNGS